MEGANEHQTEYYLSNLNKRLEAQNQIELRKLRMYHDKMDKIKHSLVRDSDRKIKVFQRKKLNPLREKNRCLATKKKNSKTRRDETRRGAAQEKDTRNRDLKVQLS